MFQNCKWVRSVVEEGRAYARKQPEINIKIAMGARLNGVNYEKIHGLLEGTFGIKMMSRRNTLHLERKIRSSISDLCKIRQEENLAKHVLAWTCEHGWRREEESIQPSHHLG